jgi:predicted O-methyltransferase YrrM
VFHDIPESIKKRMQYLERLDARHRRTRIKQFDRLRQVPPATGRFLAMTAASAPDGAVLEIGTSGGYSGMWLSLACRATGRELTTFEIDDLKFTLAAETFRKAGVGDVVVQVKGDARKHLRRYRQVGFCFLDAEKDHYQGCFDLVVPNLVKGGILVADNIISHQETLGRMVRKTMRDKRVDTMIVPIGSGLLLCRKV